MWHRGIFNKTHLSPSPFPFLLPFFVLAQLFILEPSHTMNPVQTKVLMLNVLAADGNEASPS